MSARDRDIALLAGQVREHASNFATCMARHSSAPVPFRDEFVAHYAEFRARVREFDQPGVAVVAIDRVAAQVAGVALLAARVGEPSSLIVGRHSRADFLITGDRSVSLRHLAVVIDPLTDVRDVTYRVIDLRSRQGLRTEEGKVLGGICADGPAFLGAGNYAFLFFTTGDRTDWPESPTDAWSFIPDRIYLEERPRIARGSASRPAVPMDRPITLVQSTRLPTRVEKSLLVRGERPVGEISIAAGSHRRRIAVGASALADGILVGRSERCDSHSVLCDPNLSRVHMLVVRIAGRTYALDTASTNGSYLAARPDIAVELRPLETAESLDLARVAELTWNPL